MACIVNDTIAKDIEHNLQKDAMPYLNSVINQLSHSGRHSPGQHSPWKPSAVGSCNAQVWLTQQSLFGGSEDTHSVADAAAG